VALFVEAKVKKAVVVLFHCACA